jgi:hypothetical protein
MAIAIQNDDLSILLTENSVTTTIWKDNARVLAFGDVVRITDRDGIRYEFLYTDVISPAEPSAADLADTINGYLITIVGGGGGPLNLVGSFGVNVGNGQTVILPGQVGYWTAPCDGAITDWAIQSSTANGTIQLDVWKAAGALPTVANSIIGAGVKPFLTAQRYRKQGATFTTLTFSAGDVFGFYVDSNAILTWAALQIFYTKT